MARHQYHLSRHRPVQQACSRVQNERPAQWFAAIAAFVLACILLIPTQAAAANRSLTLYFTHTKETTTIVYKRNGKFDADGLRKLNRFLRDWRRNESTQMDPALFDLIWQVYKETGAKKPIHVVSAYRSPATNNMLRKRTRGVAQNSRHTKGQAMDFYLPGVSVKTIRNVGLRMQAGGVGYYPTSRSPFVHIDTGNVRHWPRMSRKQLARVFPKGKTVHVPRDGKPFSGYKVAKAQAAKRKAAMIRSTRSVRRFSQVAKAAPSRKTASKVQLAKLSKTRAENKTTLMQSLLKKTPKTQPKPTRLANIAPVPINLEGAATDLALTAQAVTSLPRKLAKLPMRPKNRPKAVIASAPEKPAEPEIAVAKAEVDAQVDAVKPKDEAPVELAFLPRARPEALAALAQKETFQLASAAPLTTAKTLEELANEQSKQEATQPAPKASEQDAPIQQNTVQQDGPTTDPVEVPAAASNDVLTLASLPKARLVTKKAPDASEQGLAKQPEPAPEASATEILASMVEGTADDKDSQPSNRFAYATSDDTFVAALPSQRPRALLQDGTTNSDISSLPQNADRTQLASLSQDQTQTLETGQGILSTLPEARKSSSQPVPIARSASRQPRGRATNHLAHLTFAYGPSGMSHFAHMKQSTRTATFARLSRPIPNNLRGLVSKPASIIDQGFSHTPSQLLQDSQFAGAAIARMAVRSFN